MYMYFSPRRLFFILANSSDPDEMPSFYQGLNCLLKYHLGVSSIQSVRVGCLQLAGGNSTRICGHL